MTRISCSYCLDSGHDSNGNNCQECCEHLHYICLDCGYQGEPSDWYDEDYSEER